MNLRLHSAAIALFAMISIPLSAQEASGPTAGATAAGSNAQTAVNTNKEASTGAAGGATATSAKKAPTFTATDNKGQSHSLDQHKGHIVVLEWTNSGCPVVQRVYKAGIMNKLAAKYKDKGVMWLAVDSSKDASAEKENKFAEQHKVDRAILVDADGKVGKAYGAKTTPHMFVIDKDGNIAYDGALDDDPNGEKSDAKNYVDEALQAITEGKKPAVTSTESYGCGVKYAK